MSMCQCNQIELTGHVVSRHESPPKLLETDIE